MQRSASLNLLKTTVGDFTNCWLVVSTFLSQATYYEILVARNILAHFASLQNLHCIGKVAVLNSLRI